MPDKDVKKTGAPKEIHIDEQLKEEEPKIKHLKTRPVPAVIVLTAGLVASVHTFLQHRSFGDSLKIIFVTLLIFLIVGDVIKLLLDRVEIVVWPEPEEEDTGEEEETEGSGEEEEEEEE